MSEFVRPDQLIRVPISNGELLLSPAYDVVHRFQRFGTAMLKYYDQERRVMCNVPLNEPAMEFLRNEVGLYVVDRPFMMESEHEAHVSHSADNLSDADFGL